MSGKSTIDAIFILRQLQEKYREKKKKLYHVFVDLEKAFDRVPREVIEWALRRQRVPEKLVRMVMLLYEGTTSRVKTVAGKSEKFKIGVGVHQGSALSPLLFIAVMEEATKECRGEGLFELLYADDLALTGETREEAKEMFVRWKSGMERRGLKINMEKTKVMVSGRNRQQEERRGRFPCGCCGRGVGANSILCSTCSRWCHKRCSGLRRVTGVRDFVCPRCRGQGVPEREDNSIELEEGRLEEVDTFKYLGDELECEGGVEGAVRGRISASWLKWKEISSLLVNRGVPLRHRARVYEACIRPVLLYGSETWPLTVGLQEMIRTTDRRMLRYMAGVRWQDRVPSEEVLRRCDLEDIESKLRRSRLRWFGHVKRRGEDSAVGRAMRMEVPGRRPVGRPKKSWRRCIEEDMEDLGIEEDTAENRDEWRKAIARPTP